MKMDLIARRTDPQTSQETVAGIGKGEIPELIMDTLRIFKSSGLTSTQIASHINKNRDSVSPVMPKLEENGFVYRTPYVRKIGSGRRQTVWVSSEYKDFFKPYVDDEFVELKPRKTRKQFKNDALILLKQIKHEMEENEVVFAFSGEVLNKIDNLLEEE